MAEQPRVPRRIGRASRNRNPVPRGLLFFHNETRRRDIRRRLWFGIAGDPKTGRSTLATRFNALDRDELEEDEVVVRNSYTFTVNTHDRPGVHPTGFVYLGIFIDPMPIQPVGLDAFQQIVSLRALIFLFDVNNIETLVQARTMFEGYRRHEDENMLPSVLVGNKIDIRDLRRNPSAVSTLYGRNVARSIGTLEYYECSALRNIGVGPILDKILQVIVR